MNDRTGPGGGEPGQQETTHRSGNDPDGEMFVVRIAESCCEPLTERRPVAYVSPPQPLAAARSLVVLTSGRNHAAAITPGVYTVAVAGGRRTITLEAAG